MKKQKNTNKYTKLYFERYALLTLSECFKHIVISKFQKSEGPDWFSNDLGIGIEVARGITEEEGEEASVLQVYFGKNIDGNTIKSEVKNKYRGTKKQYIIDEIKLYDKLAYTSKNISSNSHHRSNKMQTICKTIIHKTEKLNFSYTRYSNNWLFIFADIDISVIEAINIVKNVFETTKFEHRYDKYFFSTDGFLIAVDPEIEPIFFELSNESLKRIKSKAFSDLF